jgi:hypothetical protein
LLRLGNGRIPLRLGARRGDPSHNEAEQKDAIKPSASAAQQNITPPA